MFLIVGLGNPGRQYEDTRHNVGFMVVNAIASMYNLTLSGKPKYKAEIAEGEIAGHKVILCKPQTFMNLSGESVACVATFYKVPPENIIVIHDEIEINNAVIRHKVGGGHAGHNGLKSLESSLGTRNFQRIRLGVGRPDDSRYDISDYVLGRFTNDQFAGIASCIRAIAEHFPLLLTGKREEFLRNLN